MGNTINIVHITPVADTAYTTRLPVVELGHMKGSEYVVHIYEALPDHTATFNWYYVNLETKEVKAEF